MRRLLEAELRKIQYYALLEWRLPVQLRVANHQLEPRQGNKTEFTFPSYKMGFKTQKDLQSYLLDQKVHNIVVKGSVDADLNKTIEKDFVYALIVPRNDLKKYVPIPTGEYATQFAKEDYINLK